MATSVFLNEIEFQLEWTMLPTVNKKISKGPVLLHNPMYYRIKKTWEECVNKDLVDLGLKKEWAQDRTNWRDLIWGNRRTHTSMDKPT